MDIFKIYTLYLKRASYLLSSHILSWSALPQWRVEKTDGIVLAHHCRKLEINCFCQISWTHCLLTPQTETRETHNNEARNFFEDTYFTIHIACWYKMSPFFQFESNKAWLVNDKDQKIRIRFEKRFEKYFDPFRNQRNMR